MRNQIFDEAGSFKREVSLGGRSQVARFPKENSIFYFKKSPEIPGYEYAATLFMRSLGLEDVPFSELLLCQDPKQGLYSVLLTQAVQGNTLDKVWQDNNNFSSLDHHHTSLLILCSMLLNPEDGKGDNYILTPDKKRIIPIDNDHVFLPGTIQEEKGFFWKTIYTELQSKTVLYCLNEMEKLIPESVAQIFIHLDIDKFLEIWLEKLKIINQIYQDLPPEDLLRKGGNEGCFFRIAFPKDYIKNLYSKIYRMKQILSEQSDLTPFDLLKSLEPFVGKLYKDIFKQKSTVLDRFMMVTDPLYRKDRNGNQISSLNSIQMFKIIDIPKTELIDRGFFGKLGPRNALETLSSLKEEIKNKEGFYQKIIKGELELKKIDASGYSEDEEKKFLTTCLKENQEVIAYHKSRYISANSLQALFKNLDIVSYLRLLDLRGAQNLGFGCAELIAKYCPNLEYLNLSENRLLQGGVFLRENFKNLKRLVVSYCPNLTALVIESSLLHVLEINNNEKLSRVFLDVPNLTYFDFTASPIKDIMQFSCSEEKLQTVKPGFNERKGIIFNIEEIFSQITAEITALEKHQIQTSCIVTEQLERMEGIFNEIGRILNFIEQQQQIEKSRVITEKHDRMRDLLKKVEEMINQGEILDKIVKRLNSIEKNLSQIESIFEKLENLLDNAGRFYEESFKILEKTRQVLKKINELKRKREFLQNITQEMQNKREGMSNKIQDTLKKMINMHLITIEEESSSSPNTERGRSAPFKIYKKPINKSLITASEQTSIRD